jgi:hypothetical protein
MRGIEDSCSAESSILSNLFAIDSCPKTDFREPATLDVGEYTVSGSLDSDTLLYLY